MTAPDYAAAWYNCWLVHRWGKWSEPRPGVRRLVTQEAVADAKIQGVPAETAITVQERCCLICNKYVIRRT